MADAFSIRATPSLDEPIGQLDRAGRSLGDLSTFWPTLGEAIVDKSQSAWPLKRRSGTLRRSLTWTGKGLGRGGVYEPMRDSLTIGTAVFYSGFHHRGTQHLRKRELLAVDPGDATKRLETWARSRVTAAGLEVSK